MKKIIISIALTLICMVGIAQNVRTSFFGLNLGDTISKEILVDAIGEKGVLLKDSDSECVFVQVYDETLYWPVAVFNADSEGKFHSIGFIVYCDDEDSALAAIDFYKKSLDYPFKQFNEGSWAYYDETGTTVLLFYGVEDDGTYHVSLKYTYKLLSDDDLPTIQNEFFGIKLGEKISESVVKEAVGDMGKYRDKKIEPSGIEYSFMDLYFAGTKWDIGYFYTDSKGRLYKFSVSISYENRTREKKDADQLYTSFKNKLASKYGEVTERVSEEEKYVLHDGSNSIWMYLSCNIGKSVGGEYRVYVDMNYIDDTIYQAVKDQENSDL